MAATHCAAEPSYHYPRAGMSLFELAASSGRGVHSAAHTLSDEPARLCGASQRVRESAVPLYEYSPAAPMQNMSHDRPQERPMHRGNSPPSLVGSRVAPPSRFYLDPHEPRYPLAGAGFVGRGEARDDEYVPGTVPAPHYMPHDGGRSDRRAPPPSPTPHAEARLSPCAGPLATGLLGSTVANRNSEQPAQDREAVIQVAGKRPHEDVKHVSPTGPVPGAVDGLTSIAANGLMSMRHNGSSATLGGSSSSHSGGGGPPCGSMVALDDRGSSERSDEDSSEEAGGRGRKRRKPGDRRPRDAREAERDDSDRDDDRKRRWMTKEQAKACQDKFDDWGGSLRGKQEEVIAFSRSIGLSALQVEKRFAYIRKHYDRVSKKLTITDDLANDGPFAKCPVAVQSLLVQRLQDLARHEMDCRRIVATLVRLAKGCRLGSEQVVVRPSRHHMSCLAEGLQRASVVPRLHSASLPMEQGPTDGGASLEEVDVVWAACRSEGDRDLPRPSLAIFHIDAGDPLTPGALQKAADCCLQYGGGVFNYIVVPSGRANHVAHRRQGPWMHALMAAVPGLAATRVIHEDSLDSLLAGQQGSNPQQGTDALELLDSVSEQL